MAVFSVAVVPVLVPPERPLVDLSLDLKRSAEVVDWQALVQDWSSAGCLTSGLGVHLEDPTALVAHPEVAAINQTSHPAPEASLDQHWPPGWKRKLRSVGSGS